MGNSWTIIRFLPASRLWQESTGSRNGFIYSLDLYVWKKACEILKKWKEAGMYGIPIEVNVSRMDIYHGDLPEQFSQQLLAVVERLRYSGFVAETEQPAQRLAMMGCQYAQGYYYGHPMTQEEFEEHFRDCCI